MKFENDLIGIDIRISGPRMTYKVINQAPVVAAIINKKQIKSGKFSLASNNYPAFKASKNIMFVRGKVAEKNQEEVTIEFGSEKEAREAREAMIDMIDKISEEENETISVTQPGTIGDVRTSIITREQAQVLKLTNCKNYPARRKAWTVVEPQQLDEQSEVIVANIAHYNEHLGQLVDVMNKSVGRVPKDIQNGVVNPHRVSSDDAVFATNAVRDLFDRASRQGEGALVATWRLVSGLRGPDLIDKDDLEAQNKKEKKRSSKKDVIGRDDEN